MAIDDELKAQILRYHFVEHWRLGTIASQLGVDETPVRVLYPGRGQTKTGYMWTMVRDERAWCGADPPGVVYRYAPSRGGAHGEKLLEGFSGTAQVDGYSGYNRLRRSERPGGALTLAACWTHARRGLKEVFDSNGSPIAKAPLWSGSRGSMRLRRRSGANHQRRARRCGGRNRRHW